MKNIDSVFLCGCFYLAVSCSSYAAAQSSVIQFPGDISRDAFSSSTGLRESRAVADSFLPSSLSARQLKWESILDQAHPEIGPDEIVMSQLLQQMRQLDLPVFLDQSARNDSLDQDERVRLELPGEPLAVRLDHTLRQHNAVLAMIGDRLQIISLDVASDPDYFLTTLYNVNAFGTDLESLIDTIKYSIDPDGWDDTNGDSSIQPSIVNGQKIVSLSAPYAVHVQVRHFLRGLNRISGGPNVSNYLVDSSTGRRGSSVVALPIPVMNDGENLRKDRKRGSGIGGFGGGGGVF